MPAQDLISIEVSPSLFLLLFLCAAGWTLFAATAGGFFALWSAHVAKTGQSPLPKSPKITVFGRKAPVEDEELPKPPRRVGP